MESGQDLSQLQDIVDQENARQHVESGSPTDMSAVGGADRSARTNSLPAGPDDGLEVDASASGVEDLHYAVESRQRSQANAWQRWLVLALSISLTTFLAGAALGSWWYSGRFSAQLSDAEFLKSRLELLNGDLGQTQKTVPPAPVRIARAERRRIVPSRPLSGRLVEYRKVMISSEVEGKILELPVEEGTSVTENKTMLVRVDDVWSRFAVTEIEAEIDSIEANLDQASHELKRLQQLAEASSITISDLESQDGLVRQLTANLAKATAVLEEKRERLARSRIYAPFDGTVIKKLAEIGQTLAVGSPVVEIVFRGTIDAEIRVPESLIDRVHIGMELPIVIEPLAMRRTGRVVSVVPYGPTASRTFPVRIRLDDQEGRLKVGMSIHATVPDGEATEEILVDKSAVLVRPDGDTVWIAAPSESSSGDAKAPGAEDVRQAKSIPVKIVARIEQEYAIRPKFTRDSGLLNAGAELIIEGAERLSNGQAVRIVSIDAAHLDNLPRASGHQLIE